MTEHEYVLRVKNGASWRRYNRVRLVISVGRTYHEADKLVAAVHWINQNPNIQEVHVSVNDFLQRYTYEADGMSPAEAAAACDLHGSQWVSHNEAILDRIRVMSMYTRWQEWTSRPNFEPTRQALFHYAVSHPGFMEALDADAHSLAHRRIRRDELVSPCLIACSRNFVQEEMAVFAMQAEVLPAAEVYPGSNLLSADYLFHLTDQDKVLLPPLLQPLAHRYFTRIDFDRIERRGQEASPLIAPTSLPIHA